IKDKEIRLWTHLAVREDALELYGFIEKKELDLFEKLISVSGIGPKSGLAILNLAPVSKLNQAISSGDTGYLTKVSGIGKKSAAKIILELKDRITEQGYVLDEKELRGEKDALLGLVSLGYGMTEARDALRKLKTKSGTTGETIKAALKLLGQQ
ncbi:MAG: Holliday junction branch migration protein RuvA, partial [bacterium]|nr:Holliday junction branch migration protein RuvA [bacterium]